MQSCVPFPEEPFFVIRPSLIAICAGHRAAAKLLSVLLYRCNLHQGHQKNATEAGNGTPMSRETRGSITRTQAQLVADMCGELSEKTLHDVALPTLQLLGYVELDETGVVHRYHLCFERIRKALAAYPQGPQCLKTVLREHLQIEPFQIDTPVENLLTEKKLFRSALEQVRLINRRSSPERRGPQPGPQAHAKHLWEAPKNPGRKNQEGMRRHPFPSAEQEQDRGARPCPADQPPWSQQPSSLVQRIAPHQDTTTPTAITTSADLTPRGQQVKAWYESLRGIELRLTEPNIRACNGLGTMTAVTRENLSAVLSLLDQDPWIKERNIAIDLQDLDRPTGRFNFERMLLVLKRKRECTDSAPREHLHDQPVPVCSLPDYTFAQPDDLYIRASPARAM